MRILRQATAILLLVVLFQLSPAAQQRSRKGLVNLSVSKIKLGSSYSQVTSRLGRPRHQRTELDDSLGSLETIRTLDYPGLTITLNKSWRSNSFYVVSIDVTSSRWLVAPGLKLGLTAEQVQARLGKPVDESDEGLRHRYHYWNAGGDGWALLEFEKNKLVGLSWTYDQT